MSGQVGGELWPHFVPLWNDLRAAAPRIKLAGGYSLFLKQQWLFSPAEDRPPTLVPVPRWKENTPRVTKDIDLIVEASLIASPEDQSATQRVLTKHGFDVVPGNARWQFEKKLDRERSVLLDFHAPPPGPGRTDVKAQSRRVKPRPTLGHQGIHGRENIQAVCSDLCPFTFVLDEVMLTIPNPVTLALMKLAAAQDQHQMAQDPARSSEQGRTAEGQAQKHAADLFRVAAMTTREESDDIPAVLDSAHGTDAFRDARTIFANLFAEADSWGTRVAGAHWGEEENNLIRGTLQRWFR